MSQIPAASTHPTNPESDPHMDLSPADPKVQSMIDSLDRTDRFNLDTLFPRKTGFLAKSDTKRRVTMLKSIEPRLDLLLYPGETIEYVASAVLNNWIDQYFLGIWSQTINRTLLVFTQHRAILLLSDSKGRAKQQAWQIPYNRLKKYGAAVWVGSVSFKLDNGKNYKFMGMKKQDRKNLKEYMQRRLSTPPEESIEFPNHEARDPLCPGCWSPTPPKTHTCEHCDERFINPRTPALMSLALPGLGNLYLGHTVVAVVEMIGFAFVLLIATDIVVSDPSAWLYGILLVAFANTFDCIATMYIARKGLISRRHTFGKKPRRVVAG
ncbi:MAG: hypothetical protein KC996_04540 [Phycisphaerales bacterium]|nr:hypothetical protein [Phycisphaerales bacterium]